MSRTLSDLTQATIDVRTCAAQVTARQALLAELRLGGHDTRLLESHLVVKEIELEMLEMRRNEIADHLFTS